MEEKICMCESCVEARAEAGITIEQVEEFVKKAKASGLVFGDRVKLLRAANDNEDGWDNTWNEEMSPHIGKIGVLLEDAGCPGGCAVYFKDQDGRTFHYPFFVLERVNPMLH